MRQCANIGIMRERIRERRRHKYSLGIFRTHYVILMYFVHNTANSNRCIHYCLQTENLSSSLQTCQMVLSFNRKFDCEGILLEPEIGSIKLSFLCSFQKIMLILVL